MYSTLAASCAEDLYPNPVQEVMTIINKSKIQSFSILDIFGNIVWSQKVDVTKPEILVNVANLAKGTYILQTNSQKGITNSKFVKI